MTVTDKDIIARNDIWVDDDVLLKRDDSWISDEDILTKDLFDEWKTREDKEDV